MKRADKDKIRVNCVDIIEELEPKDIADFLYQERILPINDYECILNEKTRGDRCRHLIQVLPTRGPFAFEKFCMSLEDNGYQDLKDKISFTTVAENDDSDLKECKKCKDFLPETTCNEYLYNLISRHCCLLYGSIEPKHILETYLKENLITDDDYENIRSRSTRMERCKLMFESLCKHNSASVYKIFKQSLEKEYDFITQTLKMVELQGTTQENVSVDSTFAARKKCPNKKLNFHQMKVKYHPKLNCMSKKRKENLRLQNSRHAIKNTSDNICNVGNIGIRIERNKMKRVCLQKNQEIASALQITKPITGTLPCNTKLVRIFNYLSTPLNQCYYDEFNKRAMLVEQKHPNDQDMYYIITYMRASKAIFLRDFEDAQKQIDIAMVVIPKTSYPKYSYAEMITVITRLSLEKGDFVSLRNILEDGKMLVCSDPPGCSGRAGGWLFVNYSRYKCHLCNANPSIKTTNECVKTNDVLQSEAIESLHLSLEHFLKDPGNDGPFGFGYALCRLVILMLRCGDEGLTMEQPIVSKTDIDNAGHFLSKLENSNIAMSEVLRIQFLLAKCDYQYRLDNHVRAREYAVMARDASVQFGALNFMQYAQNRIGYIDTNYPMDHTDEEQFIL